MEIKHLAKEKNRKGQNMKLTVFLNLIRKKEIDIDVAWVL